MAEVVLQKIEESKNWQKRKDNRDEYCGPQRAYECERQAWDLFVEYLKAAYNTIKDTQVTLRFPNPFSDEFNQYEKALDIELRKDKVIVQHLSFDRKPHDFTQVEKPIEYLKGTKDYGSKQNTIPAPMFRHEAAKEAVRVIEDTLQKNNLNNISKEEVLKSYWGPLWDPKHPNKVPDVDYKSLERSLDRMTKKKSKKTKK
jgi:hypothetical protein